MKLRSGTSTGSNRAVQSRPTKAKRPKATNAPRVFEDTTCNLEQDLIMLDAIQRGVRADTQCYEACSLNAMLLSRQRFVPHNRRNLTMQEQTLIRQACKNPL